MNYLNSGVDDGSICTGVAKALAFYSADGNTLYFVRRLLIE